MSHASASSETSHRDGTAPGAIVIDIEGTVGSIHFVRDVLFPYARKRLPAFVATHGDKAEVQHWLHEAAKEAGIVGASTHEIVALLQRWIDHDRKATALKALQGMIWEEGYANGEFKSHLYLDAVERLRQWHAHGLPLYVYSSGSAQAQQLYFGHSEFGDLRKLFSGYFDTEIGAKREWQSYHRIAERIDIAPTRILFLSDVVAELDAARAAGMRTCLIRRGEEEPSLQGPHAHPIAATFAEILT